MFDESAAKQALYVLNNVYSDSITMDIWTSWARQFPTAMAAMRETVAVWREKEALDLSEGLSRKQARVDELFRWMDADRDGRIRPDELAVWAAHNPVEFRAMAVGDVAPVARFAAAPVAVHPLSPNRPSPQPTGGGVASTWPTTKAAMRQPLRFGHLLDEQQEKKKMGFCNSRLISGKILAEGTEEQQTAEGTTEECGTQQRTERHS